MSNEAHRAGGFQIAFLIVALLFLAAPAEKYFFSQWTWAQEHAIPVTRLAIFIVAAAVLFGVPWVRRRCLRLLAAPIPAGRGREVAGAVMLNITAAFAAVGATVLLIWLVGGEPALARREGNEAKAAQQLQEALALGGVLTSIVLGGFIGPVIEEILFRGFLLSAWSRQWGWLRGAIATSVLFAAVHPNHFSQFFASLIYICVYRRTGSLRAPIVVHGLFNMSLWYPLVGQFLFPAAARGTGELSYWWFNLLCLAILAIALPMYMRISRDEP